jgi:CRISPR-associated protein Csc3
MDLDHDTLDLVLSSDASEVLRDFVQEIANKGLLEYKCIIQYGSKSGESLWAHVMNLVMTVEKLLPLFSLCECEMRCILLALAIHDINKLAEYSALPGGKTARYAEAAKLEHIETELKKLNAQEFFSEWWTYRFDIGRLAHAHQEQTPAQYDEFPLERCQLDPDRLEGALKYLMRVADLSDLSHSGNYAGYSEGHIRGKLMRRLDEALSAEQHPRRYRFVGYRLAELRGLQTNVMHNRIIAFLRATYGEEHCIDLLYHADGTDFLLDKQIPFTWNAEMQQRLAQDIGQRFADLQAGKVAQFIRAKPSGISVDDAAIESGAPLVRIFDVMKGIVATKRYTPEWREQRNTAVRGDLEAFLAQSSSQEQTALRQQVEVLLSEADLVPVDTEQLKRGEFLMAYRNFLKDHREKQCRALKQDPWQRAARLFQIPEPSDQLYALIDPYRRGYAMARELPARSLDEMEEAALADLVALGQQSTAKEADKKASAQGDMEDRQETEGLEEALDIAAIEDYLARNLQMWDDAATLPVQPVNFQETFQRYVQDGDPPRQCCYCGSALRAEEWMALQVPSSIGVQSFSNRLDGGSAREPKRNVCAICRNQFILEKLAWRSHKDKQGQEIVTFYLHLFPYSYFTRPMLEAWWESIKRLRDSSDYQALFLNTRAYYQHVEWEGRKEYLRFQATIELEWRGSNGLGIPTFAEAISNTPVLPLNIPDGNYGSKFLLALEKTVILANWFDCRIILSRIPTPLLNLEHEKLHHESGARRSGEKLDGEPVALLVESIPQSMDWLLPASALTRKDLEKLCLRLSYLHKIVVLLTPIGEKDTEIMYRLVTAAARDPLAMYHETDRLIERAFSRAKGGSKEYRALELSAKVSPLIEALLQEERIQA